MEIACGEVVPGSTPSHKKRPLFKVNSGLAKATRILQTEQSSPVRYRVFY